MTANLPTPKGPVEPWMRGTHAELDPLRCAVVHALELSLEDADRWAKPLPDAAMEAWPAALPSVGFHLRHIARSLDRLLTYAENRQLSESQLALLGTEMSPGLPEKTLKEFRDGVQTAITRVVASFSVADLKEPRGIGRMRLPTTVGGLLVHCADHTQRHIGQMVTTAKLVASRQER